MTTVLKKFYILGLFFIFQMPAFAISKSKVELIYFGPGENFDTWYGHIALNIQDSTSESPGKLYSFGYFNFEEGTILNAAKGKFRFWAGSDQTSRTIKYYVAQGRTVKILPLKLTETETEDLRNLLESSISSENRYFMYEHYTDNCSTRIYKILDKVLKGKLSAQLQSPAISTFREHTWKHTGQSPVFSRIIQFILGDFVDQKRTRESEMFLPFHFYEFLKSVIVERSDGRQNLAGAELVAQNGVYADIPNPEKRSIWPELFVGVMIGVLFIATALKAKTLKAAKITFAGMCIFVGLIIGIPGTFLFVMNCFTDHSVTYWNENLLVANPATLLLGVFGGAVPWFSIKYFIWVGRGALLLSYCSFLAVIFKIFSNFDQMNTPEIFLGLIVINALCIGFTILKLRIQKAGGEMRKV